MHASGDSVCCCAVAEIFIRMIHGFISEFEFKVATAVSFKLVKMLLMNVSST